MTRLARSRRFGNSRWPLATSLIAAVVVAAQGAVIDHAGAVPRRTGSTVPKTRRYAEPPKFDRQVTDIFFADAREVLGERSAAAPANTVTPTRPAPSGATPEAVSGEAWSEVISAEALESAVKQINQRLTKTLARPGRFKARDSFRQVKADFALLAVLLGVVTEFDGEVRWQDRAGAVRDAMVGADWEEATGEAYADAKRRHELLVTLLRGENLDLPEAVDVESWATIADRRLLMSGTETTLEESIAAALDAPRITTTVRERLVREVQLIAVAARVFQDTEYEFGDDEGFLEFAQATEATAAELRRAIEAGDQPGAREALDRVRQSCEVCHEDYRIDGS